MTRQPNHLTIAFISARTNRFSHDLIRASSHLEIGGEGEDALSPDYIANLSALQAAVYHFLAKHPPQPVRPISIPDAVKTLRAAL